MTFLILPATSYDVAELASFLRESDREEATFNAIVTGRYFEPGWSIRADLERAFEDHDLWTISREDGAVVAVGGIRPNPSDPSEGIIWLLGTDLADRHWRELTRLCARAIACFSGPFRRFGNVLPKHMMKRRRWLEHLGFDISEGEAQLQTYGLVSFWSQSLTAPKG